MKTLPTFRFVSWYQSKFACYHGMTARTKEYDNDRGMQARSVEAA